MTVCSSFVKNKGRRALIECLVSGKESRHVGHMIPLFTKLDTRFVTVREELNLDIIVTAEL